LTTRQSASLVLQDEVKRGSSYPETKAPTVGSAEAPTAKSGFFTDVPVPLAVIIITHNESARIGDCIDSVLPLATQIVVVDSGSTDDTVAIARAKGASVVVTADWPGFGAQKNRALDLAAQPWVLSLDADERVTPDLACEIRRAVAQNLDTVDAYQMARLSNFCGRWIKHGGWWPDPVVRLFRRGSARFTDAAVHERVEVQGKIGVLRGHLLHDSYPDMDDVMRKMVRYAADGAVMMHARGKRASLGSAIGHATWTFVRMYVVKRGFLDGRAGFMIAATNAMGTFLRYGKLMDLSRS